MSIVSVEKNNFFSRYSRVPHVFLSQEHLEIHLHQDNKCLYLVDSNSGLGVFLKMSGESARSPYAAPFGGFFSKDERTDCTLISQFIKNLTTYLLSIGLKDLRVSLPPSIYAVNTTTKVINSLMNGNYKIKFIPEINSHISLNYYDKSDCPKNIKETIRKTFRSNLKIEEVYEDSEKLIAYKIVEENRRSKLRKMSISYSHLRQLDKVCKSRYFMVKNNEGESIASAITFTSSPKIIYAQFWGDSLLGRSLNAMDFLTVSLVDIFKTEGWSTFDLGVSTEDGVPNSGLLRFKESHLFTSTIKFNISIDLI
jgi:hypothetical protein